MRYTRAESWCEHTGRSSLDLPIPEVSTMHGNGNQKILQEARIDQKRRLR